MRIRITLIIPMVLVLLTVFFQVMIRHQYLNGPDVIERVLHYGLYINLGISIICTMIYYVLLTWIGLRVFGATYAFSHLLSALVLDTMTLGAVSVPVRVRREVMRRWKMPPT
jgi:hypothetical protein